MVYVMGYKMSNDPPDAEFTCLTVQHTGTRWIDQSFQESRIPLKIMHFWWGRPIQGTPFTLLRNPRDIILSHTKRGKGFDTLRVELELQKEFINNGGKSFFVEEAIPQLRQWNPKKLGKLKDCKNYHSHGPGGTFDEEFYNYIMENYTYYRRYE